MPLLEGAVSQEKVEGFHDLFHHSAAPDHISQRYADLLGPVQHVGRTACHEQRPCHARNRAGR